MSRAGPGISETKPVHPIMASWAGRGKCDARSLDPCQPELSFVCQIHSLAPGVSNREERVNNFWLTNFPAFGFQLRILSVSVLSMLSTIQSVSLKTAPGSSSTPANSGSGSKTGSSDPDMSRRKQRNPKPLFNAESNDQDDDDATAADDSIAFDEKKEELEHINVIK